MKKTTKNLLCIILSVICCFSLISSAFATENTASVIGFLVAPSQYTNNENFGKGIENTINGKSSVVSLGNFGGYVSYKFENPIYDSPLNPYGIDFIVNGNAFAGHAGAAEPGQVWVSQDGETWYAIAGSEHYEDSTVWDYSVTYHKPENDGKICTFTDSLGDSGKVSSKTVSQYPLAQCYPLAEISEDNLTLSGVLIKKERTPSTAVYVETQFGYVDSKSASNSDIASNPYLENPANNCKDGQFDIALAVDENGLPVNLPWIKYIKVQTATFIDSDVFGEKSTEVTSVKIAKNTPDSVGKTKPSAITVNGQNLDLSKGNVFNIPIQNNTEFSVTVSAENANVYINNTRTEEKVFSKTTEKGIIRILVQSENRTPAVYYINTGKNIGDIVEHALSLELGSSSYAGYYGNISFWYSENENIATIDNNGIVTGISAGSTYVWGQSESGSLFKCKITVVPSADEPQTNEPSETNCSCRCHKTGISAFIWKIQLFFYKLFRTKHICQCGIAHY